ncbi:shikimate dehydrogenase family protein [Salipiger sp.]|uniref:shikimate dehydrogenase family protein n=1 Tax=Salipiger sp. TaxID=2078585 RepID=UPI003A9727D0
MYDLLNGKTRLFPIIGDPIIYVRSCEKLTEKLMGRGHNGICIPMEVPEGALEPVMAGLTAARNVDGILVTMPHKFNAFSYCSTGSTVSTLLDVVSVMRRNTDGTWHGDMLDGDAFVSAQKTFGAQPEGAKVLLLGAGGAGSAIAISLLEAGVRELIIHDTNEARVAELIGILGDLGAGRAKYGPADPTGCDMVCNATPMGMAEGDPLPLDPALLDGSMFVGDVIAGHGLTPFLKAAQDAGCKTADGDEMVVAVMEIMSDFMMNK